MNIKEELKNFEAHCLQTGQLQVAELQRNSINQIAELEKERDSANLVMAKIANNIIDLDNFEQDADEAVEFWDDLKEFALLTLGRCDS